MNDDCLTQFERELRNADSVASLVDLRARVETSRGKCLSADQKRSATEFKLRVERKAGKVLKSLGLRGGSKKVGTIRLKSLGVTQNQSTRWQALASVNEEAFNQYLTACQEDRKPPRLSKLLELAKSTSSPLSPATPASVDNEVIDELRSLVFECAMLDRLLTHDKLQLNSWQLHRAKQLVSSMQKRLSLVTRTAGQTDI